MKNTILVRSLQDYQCFHGRRVPNVNQWRIMSRFTCCNNSMNWMLANCRYFNCMALVECLRAFDGIIYNAEPRAIINKKFLAHSMLDFIRYFLALCLSGYLCMINSSNNLRDRHVHYRVDLRGFYSARCSSAEH